MHTVFVGTETWLECNKVWISTPGCGTTSATSITYVPLGHALGHLSSTKGKMGETGYAPPRKLTRNMEGTGSSVSGVTFIVLDLYVISI